MIQSPPSAFLFCTFIYPCYQWYFPWFGSPVHLSMSNHHVGLLSGRKVLWRARAKVKDSRAQPEPGSLNKQCHVWEREGLSLQSQSPIPYPLPLSPFQSEIGLGITYFFLCEKENDSIQIGKQYNAFLLRASIVPLLSVTVSPLVKAIKGNCLPKETFTIAQRGSEGGSSTATTHSQYGLFETIDNSFRLYRDLLNSRSKIWWILILLMFTAFTWNLGIFLQHVNGNLAKGHSSKKSLSLNYIVSPHQAMLCVKANLSFPWRREGATMTTSRAMIVTGLAACKCLQYTTTPPRLQSPVSATV